MELGKDQAYNYSVLVLFPETFIHLHQVSLTELSRHSLRLLCVQEKGGKSRGQAEQFFMELEVNQEERECLERDVQEAMERQLREEREERDRDSGDEWVDHSDMEECYDEHDND